jgi:D-serine deaminase-like pyridoxal phosphate-dependent protein
VRGWPIDEGAPEGRSPLAGGWAYPVALLSERALRHNVELMARYCREHGALLAPHVKTTMAPRIVEAQLAAGAWGATVAHVGQARALREAGVDRFVIANEVITAGELAWVAAADGRALMYVDSVEGVRAADRAARRDAPVAVLLEVGYAGGRTGCRTREEALAVAREAAAARGLRLAGVAAFEGLIGDLAEVDAFLREVAAVAEAVRGLLGPEPLVSAGGSAYFDRVVAVLGPVAERLGGRLILRSGCYVTHDHGVYERTGPGSRGALGGAFEPALEVWAPVLSRPEAGRAVVGAGKRDLAYDMGLPVALPELVREGERIPLAPGRVAELNDQHAHLEIDERADVRPGDLLGFGISHPCALFDRWRHLALVDSDRRVLEMIATLF